MGKFVANTPLSERIQKEQEFFDKDFLMSYSDPILLFAVSN